MTVSESYPAIHLGGLSNRILSEIGIVFSKTKTFCFEDSVCDARNPGGLLTTRQPTKNTRECRVTRHFSRKSG